MKANSRKEGLAVVISAPSGAGKTSIIAGLRSRFPEMVYSVSCTTRAPREGEVQGVDYHFMDRERFMDLVSQERLLEWKEVHGNLYGTPADPVFAALEAGRVVILDIDVKGAAEVFKALPSAIGVFIAPPDLHVLEKRLRSRGTDDEETIERRLATAIEEMKAVPLFAYLVVNDDLERAVDETERIIVREARR
jgi:guanylate kinase